jgi:hypothetical protein
VPLTIPAFDQYQQPLIPLRGLWNTPPKEGDRMVTAEIDWLVTTKSNAVQFSLSGNSPVSLSQIVALGVDNSRSGADVAFVFPDSGSQLVVPAHTQVIAPVFTNALMFYASSPAAIAGDIVCFQIFNSMPPPVPITPSSAQNHAGLTGASVVNGSTPLIGAGINGTLNTVSITIAGGTTGQLDISLVDGTGRSLFINTFSLPDNTAFNLSGIAVRFVNGLNLVVSFSTAAAGTIVANVYYSIP